VNLWLRLGTSPPNEYYRANTALILASKTALIASAIILALGPIIALRRPDIHMRLMSLGLYLFYFAVMYAQVPGFTGHMPSRALTIANMATLSIGGAAWLIGLPMSFVPHAVAQVLAWRPGIGKTPLRLPNALVLAGLAASAVADTPNKLVAYPIASAISLITRIDASTKRRTVSAMSLAPLPAILMTPLEPMYAYAAAAALSLVTSAPSPSQRPIYAAASILGRAIILAAPIHAHAAFMGIAVIMSGLCVPWLVPGILLRASPGNRTELVTLAVAATVTRLLNLLTLSAILVTSLVIYSSALILRQRAYHLEPPQ